MPVSPDHCEVEVHWLDMPEPNVGDAVTVIIEGVCYHYTVASIEDNGKYLLRVANDGREATLA